MDGFTDGPDYATVYAERFRPAFNWYTAKPFPLVDVPSAGTTLDRQRVLDEATRKR
jgi:hypothetical protein